MSKFCKITFSSEKHYEYSSDASNTFSVINRAYRPESDFQLVWQLNETPTANIFTKSFRVPIVILPGLSAGISMIIPPVQKLNSKVK